MKKLSHLCGIYVITNKINNKKYVGYSNNCRRRWHEHKDLAKHPRKEEHKRKALYRAIRKYGIENFSFEMLEGTSDDVEILKEREKYWIKKLDSYRKGYNETWGGDGVGKNNVHYGENHPLHQFTLEEVKQCRQWYSEGKRKQDIYNTYFFDRGFPGFCNMWFGRTWKDVMPEVFEHNPYPRSKVTREQVLDIRDKYENQKMKLSDIAKLYKGTLGWGTIFDIAHRKRYNEVE